MTGDRCSFEESVGYRSPTLHEVVPRVLAAHVVDHKGNFHHAVGEGKLLPAPAAHKAPRATVRARLIAVPLAPKEEDDLPTPAARKRQTPGYLHLGYVYDNVPLWCACSACPEPNLM